jgi:hypothetical protein
MSTIVLSDAISSDVTLDVEPAALSEAAGVVARRLGLHDRPLCFTLTAD